MHKPEKAYKNLNFLNSPPARHIRILCEYEEPRQRFLQHGVHDTLVFFGSARTKSREEAEQMLAAAKASVEAGEEGAAEALRRAEFAMTMSVYYEDARELAKRLTAWSMYRDGLRRYTVCTGGGPGIMEAANRGASEVDGGRSVGLGISLPFEPGVNGYVTKELAYEFHYFFTRKLWFVYMMKAMLVFPGGFGTLDELFESLTLMQTGKVKKQLPIVLFGKSYWSKVLDMQAMADFGTISQGDIDLMFQTDSVDEAYDFIVEQLEQIEESLARGT